MRGHGKGGGLQLWGGLECTINRLGERYLDQFEKSGHLDRPGDLDLVAELGIRTLRYPVLWERTSPDRPDERDWRFADERLERIRSLGMEPVVGLVHHGSGPRYTSLTDESFAPGLVCHARAVAERYPWVGAYTPVNEPLTTARFSGMYGHWYPHGRDGRTFARALMNQVRATVLSMAAIREVVPGARLVQTEDLGKTYATEPLRYQADFENARRWVTWDLLCGLVDRDHPMWPELQADGISAQELEWHLERPCPPDVIGINHYLTSERFLDHRIERYPEGTHGRNALDVYADLEAVRVLAGGVAGAGGLMREAWARYGLPLAITECHLGCTREEQARWLKSVWRQAEASRGDGIDVRAVTVWSMFGAHDWCSLLTRDHGRYEPGVFDLRAPEPRPTLLAGVVRELAEGRPVDDSQAGWWERPSRLLYPPVFANDLHESPVQAPTKGRTQARPPLLIVGVDEGLGRAFADHCGSRALDFVLLSGDEIDPACPRSVRRAMDLHRPWGVIVATNPRRTEEEGSRLGRERRVDGGILAAACAETGSRLLALSSDLVFESRRQAPYVESDPTYPFTMSGQAQVHFEREILQTLPESLVVRTGVLFGPWGNEGFVARASKGLVKGEPCRAASDSTFSPTFVPHLVDAALDLFLDGMGGVLHLANVGSTTPIALARRIARGLGADESLVLEASEAPSFGRPRQGCLASERAWIMPSLDEALDLYLNRVRLGLESKGQGFLA